LTPVTCSYKTHSLTHRWRIGAGHFTLTVGINRKQLAVSNSKGSYGGLAKKALSVEPSDWA